MNYIKCPHCGGIVEVDAVNCGIFRHGVYKSSGKQINPHASEVECARVAQENLIYGCGKPFRIIVNGNILRSVKCDYI